MNLHTPLPPNTLHTKWPELNKRYTMEEKLSDWPAQGEPIKNYFFFFSKDQGVTLVHHPAPSGLTLKIQGNVAKNSVYSGCPFATVYNWEENGVPMTSFVTPEGMDTDSFIGQSCWIKLTLHKNNGKKVGEVDIRMDLVKQVV